MASREGSFDPAVLGNPAPLPSPGLSGLCPDPLTKAVSPSFLGSLTPRPHRPTMGVTFLFLLSSPCATRCGRCQGPGPSGVTSQLEGWPPVSRRVSRLDFYAAVKEVAARRQCSHTAAILVLGIRRGPQDTEGFSFRGRRLPLSPPALLHECPRALFPARRRTSGSTSFLIGNVLLFMPHACGPAQPQDGNRFV